MYTAFKNNSNKPQRQNYDFGFKRKVHPHTT